MIGQLLDRDAGERLPGSLALAILARQRGASILRVHDVAPTVDALRVLEVVTAMEGQNE
jgi:dihydropteroate synthase